MVKTHAHSRFALKSLDDIRDSRDVILQIEKTESTFTENKKSVYLCEVVSPSMYSPAGTIESLANEVIKLNTENSRLRKKIDRIERRVYINGGSN